MKILSLLLLASLALFAQAPVAAPEAGLGPFYDSTNMAWELYGVPDLLFYGFDDSSTATITFAPPPPGYRVQITRLHGDFIAWIKSLPGDNPTPVESTAGVLLGYESTDVAGSIGCDWCAINVPLYIQMAVTPTLPYARASYDYDHLNFILAADNRLVTKVAVFLNTTGKYIHLEPTVVIDWRYVPVPTAAKPSIRVNGARLLYQTK